MFRDEARMFRDEQVLKQATRNEEMRGWRFGMGDASGLGQPTTLADHAGSQADRKLTSSTITRCVSRSKPCVCSFACALP